MSGKCCKLRIYSTACSIPADFVFRIKGAVKFFDNPLEACEWLDKKSLKVVWAVICLFFFTAPWWIVRLHAFSHCCTLFLGLHSVAAGNLFQVSLYHYKFGSDISYLLFINRWCQMSSYPVFCLLLYQSIYAVLCSLLLIKWGFLESTRILFWSVETKVELPILIFVRVWD